MSTIIETIADQLAKDVIEAQDTLDDDTLVDQIAQVIGASSPSTEEAFRTSARVRLAERRARKFLEDKLAHRDVAAPIDPSKDAPGTDIGGDH
ncbi:hypothetical protein HKCCE2091_18995 [Rhodobacterales bacterium HKCCE2091]|nr:hypothetical protein [Rhodobacterales bacterium HKCCE2091]